MSITIEERRLKFRQKIVGYAKNTNFLNACFWIIFYSIVSKKDDTEAITPEEVFDDYKIFEYMDACRSANILIDTAEAILEEKYYPLPRKYTDKEILNEIKSKCPDYDDEVYKKAMGLRKRYGYAY